MEALREFLFGIALIVLPLILVVLLANIVIDVPYLGDLFEWLGDI